MKTYKQVYADVKCLCITFVFFSVFKFNVKCTLEKNIPSTYIHIFSITYSCLKAQNLFIYKVRGCLNYNVNKARILCTLLKSIESIFLRSLFKWKDS